MSMKRVFDVFVSLAGLVILWPVMIIVWLCIRINMGSRPIFKQVRPGLSGEPFVMYKYRTMSNQRGSDGALLPDDIRMSAFGNFLRETSLDELPELINVLKGDMSLVGPRPLLMEYLSLYTPEQARRNELRPGMTGWAQVNGRNELGWEERFELDVWYVDNASFLLDIKILWLTFRKVLTRDGVSPVGGGTMPIFKGPSTEVKSK